MSERQHSAKLARHKVHGLAIDDHAAVWVQNLAADVRCKEVRATPHARYNAPTR